jgi:hypothetical protein
LVTVKNRAAHLPEVNEALANLIAEAVTSQFCVTSREI